MKFLAEESRDKQIAAMTDDVALSTALDSSDLSERERQVFEEMLSLLDRGSMDHLSQHQRAWVNDVLRRALPLDSKLIPRGRMVSTPPVLLNLPKKPPGRK